MNSFVNTYEFDSKYDDMYRAFLLSNKREDTFYLAGIIELTSYLAFDNKELYNRYFNYLFHHKGHFVRKSVLNYLLRNINLVKDVNGGERIIDF